MDVRDETSAAISEAGLHVEQIQRSQSRDMGPGNTSAGSNWTEAARIFSYVSQVISFVV